MDWLDPLIGMMGNYTDRRTYSIVRRSGLEIVDIEDLDSGRIYKQITASRLMDQSILRAFAFSATAR